MQVFEFSRKEQTNVFTIFTTAAIIIGILLFFDWKNLNLQASTAFFIVSLISLISVIRTVKQASKTFKKIIADKNQVHFYFMNKMKDKVILDVEQFTLIEKDDFIEIADKEGCIIGKAYKNRIKIKKEWDVLISLLKEENIDCTIK